MLRKKINRFSWQYIKYFFKGTFSGLGTRFTKFVNLWWGAFAIGWGLFAGAHTYYGINKLIGRLMGE